MQSHYVQTTSKGFFKSHLRKACSHIPSQSIIDRWKLEILSCHWEMEASFLQLLLEKTAKTVWSLFSMVGTKPSINTSHSVPSQLNQSVTWLIFRRDNILLAENLEFSQWCLCHLNYYYFFNLNPISYTRDCRISRYHHFTVGHLLNLYGQIDQVAAT